MAGSPQLLRLPTVPGKRHNYPLMYFDSQPGAAVFLDISKEGKIVTVAKYSAKESIGVSFLIATSCLSLVAVLGLLVLLGVSILFFHARLGISHQVFLYHRLLYGPIEPPRTRTTSSEPMSPHISFVSWLPISFKARSLHRLYDRLHLTLTLVAVASIMNARWAHSGGIEHGQFCTAQGTNA